MFNDYFNMWMRQYFDALEMMGSDKSAKAKPNDYVPFVENGLTDVINSWAKTK